MMLKFRNSHRRKKLAPMIDQPYTKKATRRAHRRNMSARIADFLLGRLG